MADLSLGGLARASSVTVFARDPAGLNAALAFILSATSFPSDKRARFDATDSETEELSFTPIQERVEAGLAATIGTVANPERFSASGVLTATPLGLESVLGAFGSLVRRDLQEYQRFVMLARQREPVVVVTRERTFASMAIRRIVRSKVPTTGNSVRLTVDFEEVRIISPLGVVQLVDLEALLAGASSSSDGGTQGSPVADVPPDVAAGGMG
jgi:hypothetical protein